VSPEATPEIPLTPTIQKHKDSLLKLWFWCWLQKYIFLRTSVKSFLWTMTS